MDFHWMCVVSFLIFYFSVCSAQRHQYRTYSTVQRRYSSPTTHQNNKLVLRGPNICNSKCCDGWQLNTVTYMCTKPICSIACRNGGRCSSPNFCTCRTNYFGRYCQFISAPDVGSTLIAARLSSDGSSPTQSTSPVRRNPNNQIEDSRNNINYNSAAARSAPTATFQLARHTLRGPCFRRVTATTCEAPLGDYTTLHDDCCATVGQAWGRTCFVCPQFFGRETECRKGFKKSPVSGRCVDVNECTAFSDICMHGQCINNQGSYWCKCDPGYVQHPSRTQCLVETRQMCYRTVIRGRCYATAGSSLMTSQMECCCSVGEAWGHQCVRCPSRNSAQYRAMCPQGTGYHYEDGNRGGGSTGVGVGSGTGNRGGSSPVSTGNRENQNACSSNRRLCQNGQCENANNALGYRCTCNSGYKVTRRGDKCININECRTQPNICNGGRCIDFTGRYLCICGSGLSSRNSGQSCVDVDECLINPCGRFLCINTLGSFKCSSNRCSAGYAFTRSRTCADINECEGDNQCENARCLNVDGSYRCLCESGFYSAPDNIQCLDVDECDIDPGICKGSSVCVNTFGSYMCNCSAGMVYDEEAEICDEPRQVLQVRKNCYLSSGRDCTQLLGGNVTKQECCCSVGGGWGTYCDTTIACPPINTDEFREVCPLGRGRTEILEQTRPPVDGNPILSGNREATKQPLIAGQGEALFNVIEVCTLFPAICGNGTCVGRDIQYNCECPNGYRYEERRQICKVSDPCVAFPNICGNGTCQGDQYGYECFCDYGLTFDEDIPGCITINPCVVDPTLCGNGSCSPSVGFWGYDCYCPLGYDYDAMKKLCVDVDLCKLYSVHCGNGTCIDLMDRIDCSCPPGFEFDYLMKICQAVNYCEDRRIDCGNGTCVNGVGTHLCQCPQGYEFSERYTACIDINECASSEGLCGNGSCTNRDGSYYCSCSNGYSYGRTNRMCVDIDECTTLIGVCGPTSSCQNTDGSYTCQCQQGFVFDEESSQCVDIDECDAVPGMCGARGDCVNTEGSVRCDCDRGYTFDEDNFDCVDIDECQVIENACSGKGRCINFQGGAFCHCTQGYKFNRDTFACEDTNECEILENVCGLTSNCINTDGSFHCVCPEGHAFNSGTSDCQDINECETVPGMCEPNGICVNTEGSAHCECESGFKFNEENRFCEDLDECQEVEDVCSGKGSCINLNGGVYCNCDPGYRFNRESLGCEDIDECKIPYYCSTYTDCINFDGGARCECREGFVANEVTGFCEDVNECQLGIDLCSNHGSCVNEIGSVRCSCDEGYIFNNETLSCEDVNECELVSTYCGNHGECVNTGGAAHCVCEDGYQFNENFFTCEDINECETQTDVCSGHGDCINHEGSAECSCYDGYTYEEQSLNCEDVDECESDVPVCYEHSSCTNTDGSFTCTCEGGYHLNEDQSACEDIDECTDEDNVCGEASCVNYEGSYNCECPIGSTLNPENMQCEDFNACESDGNICMDTRAVCHNTSPGFACLCPEGYFYNSAGACEDKNECQISTGICGNGTCVNLEGHYRCVCHDGFRLHEQSGLCIAEEVRPETPPRFGASKQPSGQSISFSCVTQGNVCGNGSCVETVSGYHCSCPRGEEFSSMVGYCVDIDECARHPSGCGAGICLNTPGSYRCNCADGYVFKKRVSRCIDRNECRRYPRICGDARCRNIVGSYECQCPAGQQFDYRVERCISTYIQIPDEPQKALDTCGRNPGVCGNGSCSFQGTRLECLCPSGYEFDLTVRQCLAINECKIPHICGRSAACEDLTVGYRCMCPVGFRYDFTTKECQSIPGPALPVNNVPTANSRNTPNACEEQMLCRDGICIDTPDGGYMCQCLDGFMLSGDGTACEDINECQGVGNLCEDGMCINVKGSFLCQCEEPLVLDSSGRRCIEILTSEEDSDPGLVDMLMETCWGRASLQSNICSNPIAENVSYRQCCCGGGVGWGTSCDSCPPRENMAYDMLCPPGSSYSLTGMQQQGGAQPQTNSRQSPSR